MRGRPLTSVSVFQKLIEHTVATTGLKVQCVLDENSYAKGQEISDELFAALPAVHDDGLGDWNYTFFPAHSMIL